jgi:hypothetical protein
MVTKASSSCLFHLVSLACLVYWVKPDSLDKPDEPEKTRLTRRGRTGEKSEFFGTLLGTDDAL